MTHDEQDKHGPTSRAMSALRSYTASTTPWGTPWWIYLTSIGAANLARQLVMPDDISTAVQITTFVLIVLTVVALVTLVHAAVARRRRR